MKDLSKDLTAIVEVYNEKKGQYDRVKGSQETIMSQIQKKYPKVTTIEEYSVIKDGLVSERDALVKKALPGIKKLKKELGIVDDEEEVVDEED